MPHVEKPNKPGPYSMPVAELQHALGLLQTDEHGLVNLRPTGKGQWAHAHEFGLQRHELYSGEARVAALSQGLPDGWRVFVSRSEPCEPFYYHSESKVTSWERPV